MAYPTKYTRQYDFVAFQNANPTRPLPADKVNADLNAVELSDGEIVDFLKTSIRSDGYIANESVGRDQLTSDVITLLDAANGSVSATVAEVLAALAVPASGIVYTPSGAIASTDVQSAITELDSEKQPKDATLTALAGVTTAADKLIYATGADAFATTDLTSFARTLVDDTTQAAMRTTLGVVPGTDVEVHDATLTALAAFNTNGLLAQTAADTFAGRTMAAPAAGITIANPGGVAGNPTFALANDLAALEGLGSTGLAARTAADTWAQRSIAVSGTGLAVSNADGAAGNPTVTIDPAAVVAAGGAIGQVAAVFKNLKVQTTANSLCSVTADEIILETTGNTSYRAISVSLAAIDVSTSGANGLDTGAEASSTWYSVWVIYNGTTVAGLLSTSATAPTMPATYTYKARVGWIRNDGSSNYLRTLQYGRRAQYVVGTNPTVVPSIATSTGGAVGTYSATSPVLATASVTTVVPTATASMIGILAINTYKTDNTPDNVLVAPNTGWGGTNNGPLGSAGQLWPIYMPASLATGSSHFNWSRDVWLMLEATTIAWCADSTHSALSCIGWEDNL